jgi:hypothetical protein
MLQRRFLAMIMLGTASVLVAGGCGGEASKGVTVTGSVSKAGKAQDGVSVGFVASDPKQGQSAGARTDADGKFQLQVKPGAYKVTLTRLVDKKGNAPKESDNPAEDFTQLEASGYLRNAFPATYADPNTSPLTVDIPAGGKSLDPFEVK